MAEATGDKQTTDPKDLQFDPNNSNLQPGQIEDPEAFAAAVESGTVGIIDPENRSSNETGNHAVPDGEPNIIFIGRKTLNGELVLADAPESLRDGLAIFDLPGSKVQARGFYHPEAARIVRAFPQLYKQFVKKGESSNG